MGKKQKKVVPSKVEADVPESNEEMEIKTEEDIKEEPEETGLKRNPRARLIVRNLSFKASEDKLKSHFSQYGELTDVQVLRHKDGRLVGCAFVEYSLKNSAAKAIANASGKPFLNRPVVVDWAVQKGKFVNKSQKAGEDDSEESGFHEENDSKIKKEDDDSDDSNDDEGDDNSDDDNDNNDSQDGTDDDDSDQDGSDDDDSDSDDDDRKSKRKKKNEKNPALTRRKPLRESHDISEGCTVFVKNIPFSVDNEEFKKHMRQFGLIYYALICVDHLTEHSKGTGFVKFRTKESADACLEAGSEGKISIRGSVVETMPAQSRDDLQKGGQKKDVKKDNRHLYLVKEGIILAGSPAAAGVSQADMAKRLQLEQWKTQMLRNLNKFVSMYRLVVQNLPPTYDDSKLRALLMKYGGKNPVITESRVMRDLRNVDANGVGKSKEFGFVTFTNHENALHALRALNNNPEVFTPAKRPIVAFSIEDKTAINTRQKRLEKSRAGLARARDQRQGNGSGPSQKEWENRRREEKHNKMGEKKQGFKGKANESSSKSPVKSPQGPTEQLSKKEKMKLKFQKFQEKKRNSKAGGAAPGASSGNAESANFMGETAKQGQSGIMSRKKLRAQVNLQAEATKAKSKRERKRKQQASIKIKQPKQKMNKPKGPREQDNFSNLVNKYKSQLASSEVERKKWYEQ